MNFSLIVNLCSLPEWFTKEDTLLYSVLQKLEIVDGLLLSVKEESRDSV